jgi:putative lipase involved disintegration of autophagic bodies
MRSMTAGSEAMPSRQRPGLPPHPIGESLGSRRAFVDVRQSTMAVVLAVLIAQFTPATSQSPARAAERQPQQVTPQIAGEYAIYAMLASNAYHAHDRMWFPVDKAGWLQFDQRGKPTTQPSRLHRITGLAYDVCEKPGTDEVVFAIRGTDSKRDHLLANFAAPPWSLQYTQVNREIGKYIRDHPGKKITVTGHSLGGGLALSASVRYGVDAVVFDPSPRIFDGLGDKHVPAQRVVICEDRDFLAVARSHWGKVAEVVPQENVYRCSFARSAIGAHRMDHLARGLLELGVTVNEQLVPVRDALRDEKDGS